jgi:hypothetical protein
MAATTDLAYGTSLHAGLLLEGLDVRVTCGAVVLYSSAAFAVHLRAEDPAPFPTTAPGALKDVP